MLNKKRLFKLLLIIAIVSVFSYVIFLSLDLNQTRKRDTRRIEDLGQFMKNLEIYYNVYKAYPCGDTNDENNDTNRNGTSDSSNNCLDPGTDTNGFLNGLGNPASINIANCKGYTGGLFSIGAQNSSCPIDPLNDATGNPPHAYWYNVSADRQLYVITTYLENNDKIMANDGGLCPKYYEVGTGLGSIKISDTAEKYLGNGCGD